MQTTIYGYYRAHNWVLQRDDKNPNRFTVVNGYWDLIVDAEGRAQHAHCEYAFPEPRVLGEPDWEGNAIPGALVGHERCNELLNWIDQQIVLKTQRDATVAEEIRALPFVDPANPRPAPVSIAPATLARVCALMVKKASPKARLEALQGLVGDVVAADLQRCLHEQGLLPRP